MIPKSKRAKIHPELLEIAPECKDRLHTGAARRPVPTFPLFDLKAWSSKVNGILRPGRIIEGDSSIRRANDKAFKDYHRGGKPCKAIAEDLWVSETRVGHRLDHFNTTIAGVMGWLVEHGESYDPDNLEQWDPVERERLMLSLPGREHLLSLFWQRILTNDEIFTALEGTEQDHKQLKKYQREKGAKAANFRRRVGLKALKTSNFVPEEKPGRINIAPAHAAFLHQGLDRLVA